MTPHYADDWLTLYGGDCREVLRWLPSDSVDCVMVANRLSRRAILIDLNPEYLKQQMKRNAQTPLGLTEGLHA